MEQEDYLETIHNLKKELGHVRISDIANALNLSKPSVTQMMQRLEKEGYVEYKPYLQLKLTAKGSRLGRSVAEKHSVLADFLTTLGIPKTVQERDIHGIEHFLSPITLKKLKKTTKFLKDRKFR